MTQIEKVLNEAAEKVAIAIGIIGFAIGMIGMSTDAGMLLFWAISLIAASAFILGNEEEE